MKRIFGFSIIVLAASILLLSCKKDKAGEPEFDVNNPVGYVVAGKFNSSTQSGAVEIPVVFEFLPDQKARYGIIFGTGELDYVLNADTFLFNGLKLLIKNNKVTYFNYSGLEFHNPAFNLLKKPATNLLSGKTYTGTYYNQNQSVLHPQFFYGFKAENKVDAGYTVGTTVRTEAYNSIANISALVEGKGFREFMLLNEGKLEVMYFIIGTGQIYFGTFDPQ